MILACVALASSLLLARAQAEEPTWQGKTAVQWADELQRGATSEALEAFTHFDAAVTAPLLVERIVAWEPAAAWNALRALRKPPSWDSVQSRAAGRAAAAELAKGLAKSDDPAREVLFVLGLAALGEQSAKEAPALVRELAEASSPALRLTCAIALVHVGEEAGKALAASSPDASIQVEALSHAVHAAVGARAKNVKKDLEKLIARDESWRAYLLAESAYAALVAAGEKAAALEAVVKRRELPLTLPVSEGLNWRGVVALDPKMYVEGTVGTLQLEDIHPERCAKPEKFEKTLLSRQSTFADGCALFLAHLHRVIPTAGEDVRRDAFPTLEAYAQALEPWCELAKFLAALEARLPAQPRK